MPFRLDDSENFNHGPSDLSVLLTLLFAFLCRVSRRLCYEDEKAVRIIDLI